MLVKKSPAYKGPMTVGWTFMSTTPEPEFAEIGNEYYYSVDGHKQLFFVDRKIIYPLFVTKSNTCPVDMNVHPTGLL
jgi:hypothetical protein